MSSKNLIESVARGAEKLIGENRKLREEVEKLQTARERLREENRRLDGENAELQRRLVVRDLAAGFAGEPTERHGAKTARTRVGRLMREVDKCIALLNKGAGE